MEQIVAKISSTFRNQFEKKPKLYRSPGRVNLIGEHTDYNAGFVLPAAIDKMIVFAINENSNNCSRVYAHDLNESYEFSINELKKSPKGWPNYLMGVVDQFVKSGKTIGGFDCVFGGNIPIGAGMSSSAAIEAGLAMALNELFKLNMEKLPLVELARRAENEFVGVQCGIMDQFINLFGRDNQVLLLDCRSLEHNYYPFDKDHMYIVLCDTRVRRALASSEYNIRKDQCEKAVQILSQFDRSIKSLR
ncbi:MAG: galactokinase, partial [Calditrichae bacterium]|nr:galactokinase [Calditrichia bacterium]